MVANRMEPAEGLLQPLQPRTTCVTVSGISAWDGPRRLLRRGITAGGRNQLGIGCAVRVGKLVGLWFSISSLRAVSAIASKEGIECPTSTHAV